MPRSPLAGLILLSCAAGCGATQEAATPRLDPCGPWSPPLAFSAAAVAAMDRGDLEQLAAYYRYGEARCGWRPAEAEPAE